MEDDISLIDAYDVVPNGIMKYVSPNCFETMFTRLVEKNIAPDIPCEGEGFEVYLEGLKIHILAHISYWFEVVSDHPGDGYLHVHSFALDMVKKYAHVLYLIELFENGVHAGFLDDCCLSHSPFTDPCDNGVRELTEDEYVELYFPGASAAVSGNIFMYSHGHWHIRFDGRFVFAKDIKGMNVLELLLSCPGESIPYSHMNDIVNQTGTVLDDVKYIGEYEFKEESLFEEDAVDNVYKTHSAPRKKNVERWNKTKKLIELGKEYESCTENSKRKEIKDNIDRMQQSLEALGDMSHEESYYKKMYNGISKNLRDTRRYIKTFFPELHSHLQESLKYSNCYTPKENIHWNTKYNKKEFNRSISGHAANFNAYD